jgi:predicted transcriptional regulator
MSFAMSTGSLDDYDLWLLEAAANGPSSIEELSERGNVPKSTAYRRVPILADRGLLKFHKRDSGIGRPALIYSITDLGVQELRTFTDSLRKTLDRLARVVDSLGPTANGA